MDNLEKNYKNAIYDFASDSKTLKNKRNNVGDEMEIKMKAMEITIR